jgi:hypothetical protein
MSQNEFASQLTKMGFPSNIDAATMAEVALRRNRRRIRVLSALTIGLWVIDFLLVPAAWLPFAAMMKQKMILLDHAMTGKAAPMTVDALTKIVKELCQQLSIGSGFVLAIMTLASLLAAISTVWLVLTVRRVTLEQVSIGLAQIAQQLQRIESSR